MEQFTQIREGMKVDFNVPIKMSDGIELRANIYRPLHDGIYPVIFSYGVYGKDLHIEEIYSTAWKDILSFSPATGVGSTNIHQQWELIDPEKWCPDGYVVMRVDSRGAGCSPGYISPYRRREAQDMYECIEWTAAQPWCNGKIGINGISYYSVSAWNAASLQPPHLAAFIAWEGHNDYYRECSHHGGIANTWFDDWSRNQILPVQYGKGDQGYKSRATGKNVSGDVYLSETERAQNRIDFVQELTAHPLVDDYAKDHTADLPNIQCPFLSAGNWGGPGLHLRGNVEGFIRAGSEEKFLEMHGMTHWTHFYSDYGIALQKQFFGYYLKGEDTGWKKRKKVQLQIRHVDETFTERFEDEFPLARTQYTKFYLDPTHYELSTTPNKVSDKVTYKGLSDGVTFMTPPLEEETEITGYSRAILNLSSETSDADLFLVLRIFTPDLAEVAFNGANDPNTPVALGWLRASHRKVDPNLSTAYRPWHPHDEIQPLEPGKPYELDIEIWPTCIVVPKGYRIGLTIRGKDYINAVAADGHIRMSNIFRPLTGCGTLMHDSVVDRPPAIFDKDVTIHFDPDKQNYIQLPIIPKK